MQINSEYPLMIFKNDNGYYSIGMSKKNQDGTYTNGYMPCQFKKGVELDNQTNIYIKQAWLKFYIKDNRTMPYVFINEYALVSDAIKSLEKDEVSVSEDDLPF